MDEGNRIIRGGFSRIAVVAPQVHALDQKGDEIFIVGMGRGRVKSDIMKNPEIG